jgi:hypothetical protein
MLRHVKETPPPPRTLNPRLSEELERVVMRCLAKEPAERPASALSVAEELCAAVGRTLSPATQSSTSRARAIVSESVPSAGFSAAISRTLRLERPAHRRLAAGAAVVAAVVLAVALWARPHAEQVAATAARPASRPALQRLVQVRLQSMPSGATVSENGVRLGVTPYDLSAAPGSNHVIEFALAGHQSARQAFRAEADTTLAAVLEPAEPAPRAGEAASSPGTERARRRAARRVTPGASPGGTDRDLDSRARTINPFAR